MGGPSSMREELARGRDSGSLGGRNRNSEIRWCESILVGIFFGSVGWLLNGRVILLLVINEVLLSNVGRFIGGIFGVHVDYAVVRLTDDVVGVVVDLVARMG